MGKGKSQDPEWTYSFADFLIWAYPELSNGAKKVMLTLREIGDWSSPARWPSIETLSTRSGVSSATVKKALVALRNADLLRTSHKDTGRVRGDGSPVYVDSLHTLLAPSEARLEAFQTALSQRGVTGHKLVAHTVPLHAPIKIRTGASKREERDERIYFLSNYGDLAKANLEKRLQAAWGVLSLRWSALQEDEKGWAISAGRGSPRANLFEAVGEDGALYLALGLEDLANAVQAKKIAPKPKDITAYVRSAVATARARLLDSSNLDPDEPLPKPKEAVEPESKDEDEAPVLSIVPDPDLDPESLENLVSSVLDD